MGILDRFRRDKPMTDAELNERSKVDGIRFKELAVLGQLTEMGADATVPRDCLFYCLTPTEEAAHACASGLREFDTDLEVTVEPAPEEWLADNPDTLYPWTVVVQCSTRALIPDFLRDTVDACEQHAAANGGIYDGWEAGLTDAENDELSR
jgi:hypothetical protein